MKKQRKLENYGGYFPHKELTKRQYLRYLYYRRNNFTIKQSIDKALKIKKNTDNLSWVDKAEKERIKNSKERDDFWRTH